MGKTSFFRLTFGLDRRTPRNTCLFVMLTYLRLAQFLAFPSFRICVVLQLCFDDFAFNLYPIGTQFLLHYNQYILSALFCIVVLSAEALTDGVECRILRLKYPHPFSSLGPLTSTAFPFAPPIIRNDTLNGASLSPT
jgi:hypothetical protein